MIRVIIFVLCFVIVHSEYEGDYCTVIRTNSPGTCTQFTRCKSALADLRMRRIPPQSCGFTDLNVVLVCCPDTSAKATTTTTTTQKTYINEDECVYPPEAITVKRTDYPNKSWNKCIDLANNIFPCRQVSFGIGAKKSRVDTCGHPPAQLIIGGTPTKSGEFPHMAALGFINTERNIIVWDCGGTLISEQWVMSAAHCLFHRTLNTEVSKVRLGEIDLSVVAEPRNLFDITEKVKHPDYLGNKVYNDITLLKLDRPVKYSDTIRPACLHVGNNVNDNKAIATGFGVTSTSSGAESKSNILLKVTVNKFTKEECSTKNPPQRKSPNGVIDTQICYGSKNESKDTCQGDSGGPLQIYNLGVYCTHTVIGITSVGKLCGTPGFPALYTRVSEFIPWIESVVWPN